MSRTLIFTLSCIFFVHLLPAQFVPEPIAAPGENHGSFLDLQTQYHNWAFSHDPDQQKGWKWYARWAHEVESRLQGDGTVAHSHLLFEEAIRYARLKNGKQAGRQANWAPVGPTNLPVRTDPQSIHGMGRINTIAFHPTDKNTFWVGVAQGGVWKTTNDGQSWMPLTDELPILRISDIAVDPKHPDTMYISVGDYAYMAIALDLDDRNRHTHYGLGVYKTVDGGQNWQPTGLTFQQLEKDGSLTRRVFIDENDPDELVAAGIFGIRKSYDGGNSWISKSDSLIWDLERDPINKNILYASCAYLHTLQSGAAAIMKSTDFGETWTVLPTNLPPRAVQRVELAISPSDPNYLYAVACDLESGFYGCLRSTNGGQNWDMRNAFATDSLNILHWSDGDRNTGGQGTYDLILAVDPNDKEKIYAGGINAWGSTDGGTTWNGVSYWTNNFGPSIHADQHFLAVNPLDDKFYLCNDGGLVRTDEIRMGSWLDAQIDPNYNWPTQWEDLSDGLQVRSFYRLGLSEGNPNMVTAGAQDNGTSFLNNINRWIQTTGGDGMECAIHPTNPNILYSSSQYGNLYRSNTGGSWFDYISGDIRFTYGDRGEWTTPFAQFPNDPNKLIAGFGQVYVSNDTGWTWNPISSFSNMPGVSFSSPASTLAMAPGDPQTIYVAKRIYHSFNQPSEIYRTTDGGQNWTNITSGLPDSLYFTYLTVDDKDPMKVWLSVKGFTAGVKVFYSENGGNSWQNISKNLPNVSANCIVHEPGNAVNTVYVGMDAGIYYHSDTSTQWALYSDGLPNVIVSELEVHQGEAKLYAATFGRGVWVSDLAGIASSIEKEQLNALDVQLFPNPNDGDFRLRLDQLNFESLNLEVVDVMGRRVHAEQINVVTGKLEKDFKLNLPFGLYFLRMQHGQANRVVRFVVEK